MTNTATITMVDGIKIIVPDSLELITPYVLREQEDWFEDEIKFLRRFLQPGCQVIDIGANFGVYTLSMAKAVGAGGRVWAFEPGSGAAELLAEAVSTNGFNQITLDRRALSSFHGEARLSLNQNSEMNALLGENSQANSYETVEVVTLDECLVAYDWQEIDFIKIDAEGEEENILKGGKKFFAELSPLVQYEVKAGAELHLELVAAFKSMGYNSYRLVRSLNLLVPVDLGTPPDGYLLNLFCCKPDRAADLARRGVLLEQITGSGGPDSITADDIAKYGWRRTLVNLPYGNLLKEFWEETMEGESLSEVEKALALFSMNRDQTIPAAERFQALRESYDLLRKLCRNNTGNLRLASLARVARDFGARTEAVNALTQLNNDIFQGKDIDPGEPFLAPGPRFDNLVPGETLGNWLMTAILESYEELFHYSSFYEGQAAQPRLETICNMGLAGPAMLRRLDLLRQRFNLPRPAATNR